MPPAKEVARRGPRAWAAGAMGMSGVATAGALLVPGPCTTFDGLVPRADAASSVDVLPRDAPPMDVAPRDAMPAEAEAACSFSVGAFPCSSIPPFRGTQVVDGLGNEFCNFPAVPFAINALAADGGPDTTSGAYIQVGWSTSGLHAFVHVAEAEVSLAPAHASVFDGDAFEIFASANAHLTGLYGPGFDEAIHVIMTPPVNGQASACLPYTNVGGKPSAGLLLPATECATRLVPGGYNVELELSWSRIAGATVQAPVVGDSIGLDFQADLHRARADAGQLSRDLSLKVISESCGQLFCDDRTWCLWTLAP